MAGPRFFPWRRRSATPPAPGTLRRLLPTLLFVPLVLIPLLADAGQADAAVVTRASLEINRQLNPQLNRTLIVPAESRNLSDGITCLTHSAPESFRARFIQSVMRLNGTKSGQQLFTLFQSNGVTHFPPVQPEGREQLLHEHERMKTRTAQRK
jgi:hypothetical protein